MVQKKVLDFQNCDNEKFHADLSINFFHEIYLKLSSLSTFPYWIVFISLVFIFKVILYKLFFSSRHTKCTFQHYCVLTICSPNLSLSESPLFHSSLFSPYISECEEKVLPMFAESTETTTSQLAMKNCFSIISSVLEYRSGKVRALAFSLRRVLKFV